MKETSAVQQAIHEASSAEAVGEILRKFFETLSPQERSMLGPELSATSTFSNSTVGQRALDIAREEQLAGKGDRRLPVINRVSAVLSSASLRLGVIEIEGRG
jgi:hypothetical protein